METCVAAHIFGVGIVIASFEKQYYMNLNFNFVVVRSDALGVRFFPYSNEFHIDFNFRLSEVMYPKACWILIRTGTRSKIMSRPGLYNSHPVSSYFKGV